jgi:hypothetical protein
MNLQQSTSMVEHVVADVLSKLPNNSKPLGVLNQTIDASLFSVKPIWM